MKDLFIFIGKCILAVIAIIGLLFLLVLPEMLLDLNDFLRPYIGSVGVTSIWVLIIAGIIMFTKDK